MRKDNRDNLQLREISFKPDYIKNVPGSALSRQGDTIVLCTALYEERVPPFLKNSDKGWIQAEYSMLPGSTGNQRVQRERQRINNRHIEIQRFIGRALRTTIDLKKIEGFTINVDADVIQADGGTRCAAINGSMLALAKTIRSMVYDTVIRDIPPILFIAAVSIGITDNEILVDLNYDEDFKADADINIVSSENGDIVEVQAFAEESIIPKDIFYKVVDIGIQKNIEIIEKIKKYI